MDDPSVQILMDLRDSIARSLKTHRPLLHHLNPDTSWFLQIPRPSIGLRKRSSRSRHWYNILIDPWLSGSQIDVASWFSQQWHVEPCGVASISELESLARQIESMTAEDSQEDDNDGLSKQQPCDAPESMIDVVAVLHEFTDHAHKGTMLQIHPNVPVFATTKAAAMIRSWNHFRFVEEIPIFPKKSNDWRDSSLPPLPNWLSIVRLVSDGEPLYFHSALMIVFDSKPLDLSSEDSIAEAIVYTPHGIKASDLEVVNTASPTICTLALLHGRHEVYLGSRGPQLNLGAQNGAAAQLVLNAKYWIGTHDEIKIGSGIIGWLLTFKKQSAHDPKFREVRNGQSVVLT